MFFKKIKLNDKILELFFYENKVAIIFLKNSSVKRIKRDICNFSHFILYFMITVSFVNINEPILDLLTY